MSAALDLCAHRDAPLPALFPLAPHLNAHARADRNSLAIRRMWTDLITARWQPAY